MFALMYEKKMFGLFILSIPLVIYYYSLAKPKDSLDNKIDEHEQEDEEHDADDINLWSELDVNLLGEILNRLCLTDQARFRGVCKNWLAAPLPMNTKKSLPWYLSFDSSLTPVTGQFELQLYDPSSPDLASLHNITLSEFGIPSSYKKVIAIVKHNWLLIFIRKRRWFFWKRRYFLLFSPLTRKIITLPKLDYPRRFMFRTTFSTQPDSPDCVFFLLDIHHASKIALLTYRNADKKWTSKQFNTVTDFLPCSCDVFYLRGMLYIVSHCGQLASYNTVDGELKFECLLVNERFVLNFVSGRIFKVFELNGELMILFLDSHTKEDVTSLGKQFISRYDWSNKVWGPVNTLDDKALFVNNESLEIAIIDKLDMRYNGVLSNMIYHFLDDGCIIYSIEDGELFEFKFISSNSLKDGGGGGLHIYENKYGTTVTDTNKSFYWLVPPSDSLRTVKIDY